MILRDRRSTSYVRMTWHHFFLAGQVLWTDGTQNALARGRQLYSTFHFRRKSRRIALFLVLSISKIEEVLCFVFDAVKFKNSGRLAE